ncbi:MAG: ATP-binding cassette domain-containing protein [Acidobacteria bacterium]|nr:ATP-binding cassette domain-containing protein [Acidobacteriota bacterium]
MTARLDVRLALPLDRFPLDVAFEAETGCLGLFGPSGAGKTALLESIAGLRRGARGRIALGAATWLDSSRRRLVPPEVRGIGYVPQDALLFPHWNVMGNVLAGARRASGAAASRIDPEHVVAVLDLEPLRPREVATLSGGERQRVALARALCSAPALLLLDEPLASIDPQLRGRILHYLLAVRDEFRIPTIYVSHDATEIAALCGDVVVLREGRIAARGEPSRVFGEESDRAGVLGSDYENILDVTVEAVEPGRVVARLPGGVRLALASAGGAAPGSRALVGIRAGDLLLAVGETSGLSARNVVAGTIDRIRDVGEGTLVFVAIPGIPAPLVAMVTASASAAMGLRGGMSVHLVTKAQSCRLLAVR